MLTNKSFCYWLQGYFEITTSPRLSIARIKQIENQLASIDEPLGLYTSWLKQTLQAVRQCDYRDSIIQLFQPKIINELNLIFQHDIDNSYDTKLPQEYLQRIHDGDNSSGSFL